MLVLRVLINDGVDSKSDNMSVNMEKLNLLNGFEISSCI